jgi:hypothetical protein
MSQTKKILKRLASEGLNNKNPYTDTASTMKKLDANDKAADLKKKK